MKIDSHQHFWAINPTDYGWMTDQHDVIRRDFLPVALRPLLDAADIDGCVAVQARQIMLETEWLLELADAHDWIRGVVGWVPLCDRAGEPFLETYARHPKLCGVRHIVHDEPDDDFILRPDFNEGIRNLANHGLVYDILIHWKHLPQTIRFVDRHPSQPFVVDHIAKPRIERQAFDSEWEAGIRELAKREHVSCKISGMVTEVRDESWDADLLRPYFETVFEAFGPRRVVYGSDWPVCLLRSSYADWWQAVAGFSSALSADEQEAFLGGNAARIYRL